MPRLVSSSSSFSPFSSAVSAMLLCVVLSSFLVSPARGAACVVDASLGPYFAFTSALLQGTCTSISVNAGTYAFANFTITQNNLAITGNAGTALALIQLVGVNNVITAGISVSFQHLTFRVAPNTQRDQNVQVNVQTTSGRMVDQMTVETDTTANFATYVTSQLSSAQTPEKRAFFITKNTGASQATTTATWTDCYFTSAVEFMNAPDGIAATTIRYPTYPFASNTYEFPTPASKWFPMGIYFAADNCMGTCGLKNWAITSCIFEGMHTAISLTGTSGTLTISTNTFHDFTHLGVEVVDGTNITITNNLFGTSKMVSGAAISVNQQTAYGIQALTIKGNSMNSTYNDASYTALIKSPRVGIQISGLKINNIQPLTVLSNNIKGSFTHGILSDYITCTQMLLNNGGAGYTTGACSTCTCARPNPGVLYQSNTIALTSPLASSVNTVNNGYMIGYAVVVAPGLSVTPTTLATAAYFCDSTNNAGCS
eukprot:gnl/Hemi2/26767_TR9004_c0_g1_i1.p1 gnl/Hemi2/26767_TR9004_c0_g1~~gnl/Hemi2/26767_TR9004_c0_g1_i1.p1  ORF type:complete len:528 (+),score=157.18 gnl/Hemi2/26767_TR9004_c0_g1_i1:134-1585(+)